MLQWLKQMVGLNPLPPSVNELDWTKIDLDLISNLFGIQEAKNQLLNIYQPKEITPEQVIKDATAMELMKRTYPWKIYEQAVWRRFINAMQMALASKTLEEREIYRSQVKAYLAVMHLPYELSQEKARIEKTRDLMKEAQNANL